MRLLELMCLIKMNSIQTRCGEDIRYRIRGLKGNLICKSQKCLPRKRNPARPFLGRSGPGERSSEVLWPMQWRDACTTVIYESVFQFIHHDRGSFRFRNCSENLARVSRLSRPWSEFDSLCGEYRWRDKLRTTWSSYYPRENWKRESKKALRISRVIVTII